MSNGKSMMIILTVGLIKKRHSINEWIFSKTESLQDLPNYVTKADLKNATGIDSTDFAKDTDLAHLKSDVDELDTDKFKNVPSK